MGKEKDLSARLLQSVIEFVRKNHADTIDKTYEYFWDERYPEEFLNQTGLEIGFMNFEDWLISDYKDKPTGETFIDMYNKSSDALDTQEREILNKVKDSVLSLYEVMSVAKDKKLKIKDVLLGGEFELRDRILTKGLKKGDIFATRLLPLDGRHVMSSCVYPYKRDQKKTVLDYINKQFKRYLKNVAPHGTMKDYLKDYGDIFNIIWMKLILDSKKISA